MFDVFELASMLLFVILPIPIPPVFLRHLEIVVSVAIKTVIGYQMSLGNEQTHQLLSTTKWIKTTFF